jgi:predicted DNA-binding transcriptional regulator AlpA
MTRQPLSPRVAHFDELPDDALIPFKDAQLLLGGWSRATIWRRADEGVIPKPRRMPGSVKIAWTAAELRSVLKRKPEAAA